MTEGIDERPPPLTVVGALLVGVVLTLSLAAADVAAAVAASIALPCLLIAGHTTSRRALGAAVGAIVLAVVLAGVGGADADVVLAAAVLGILAWDLLEHGLSLGSQVGRSADANRSLLVHSGATLIIGTLLAGMGLVGLSIVPAGWPVMALVFAVLAGIVALFAVDRTQ